MQTRIVASMICSRPALTLAPLSPLQSTSYDYYQRINTALTEPFQSENYFRKGSAAEAAFKDRDAAPIASTLSSPAKSSRNDSDLTDLNRQPDRTLYLLLRKPAHKKGQWQFRARSVSLNET